MSGKRDRRLHIKTGKFVMETNYSC